MNWGFFFVPFVPIVTRGWLFIRHRSLLNDCVPADWSNPDANRVVIIGIAGFGFTGVVGITVLESATRRQELQLPIFYLLVSFLCSLVALNLESYRFFISRLIIGGILYDIATLALIAAVLAIVIMAGYPLAFTCIVIAVAIMAWAPDHYLGVKYSNMIFKRTEERKKRQEEEEKQKKEEVAPVAVKNGVAK